MVKFGLLCNIKTVISVKGIGDREFYLNHLGEMLRETERLIASNNNSRGHRSVPWSTTDFLHWIKSRLFGVFSAFLSLRGIGQV